MSILCSISTRGRYDTTLPLAMMAVINQTRRPDKLIVFDDNDSPRDVRENQHYQYMFQMMDNLNMKWEWLYAKRIGQHHNHQIANQMGYDWVWRVDDDCVPEPNVLRVLHTHALTSTKVGAVGGAILTPPLTDYSSYKITGKIGEISHEPNIQWGRIPTVRSVDHLHCSFIYRAGVHDYNLSLSRVAHREETLFTYGLKQKGYDVLVVPEADTWHLKNKDGGIRMEANLELFAQDEVLFEKVLGLGGPIVVLNGGMGDHVVFSRVLPDIKDAVVFSCYPEIVPGRSIQEAKDLLGSIDSYDVYRRMDAWKWALPLEDAFRKMYIL